MQKHSHPFLVVLVSFLLVGAGLILQPVTRTNLSAPSRAYAQSSPGSLIFLPFVRVSNKPHNITARVDWLGYLNGYRQQAGLPAVTENMSWSTGGADHARYTVKNDILQHNEEVGNPWFTPDGQAAAQASNLMASWNSQTSDKSAIDSWLQAPFHAVGMLDPALRQVGYGSYREDDGGLQMSASLDVLRGAGEIPPDINFPIYWPGSGMVIDHTSFTSETPNPLTSCPGYTAPSGFPVILQIGPGDLSPVVTDHAFLQGDSPLEHCLFTETTYNNPNSSQQDTARAILDGRDAIVLIPRQPLIPGVQYTVSITANGVPYSWSFRVSDIAGQ